MRYARLRCQTQTLFRLALTIMSVAGVTACAVNTHQPDQLPPTGSTELVATEPYLPIRDQDRNGKQLPYEPMANPYTELEGQLDKKVVITYIKARRAFNDNRLEKAEQLLTPLIEQEPDLSGPLVLRGDIALQREQLPRAAQHYREALQINPINFNAWLRLAKAQRMLGKFRQAQNTYAQALSRWPDGAELHLNLGVLYDVYLNMPLEAQAHMEAYQVLSGDNSGEVVAWLKEVRQRTGVAEALTTVGESSTDPRVTPDSPEEESSVAAREATGN